MITAPSRGSAASMHDHSDTPGPHESSRSVALRQRSTFLAAKQVGSGAPLDLRLQGRETALVEARHRLDRGIIVEIRRRIVVRVAAIERAVPLHLGAALAGRG